VIEAAAAPLSARRLLVVEDEYTIALDLAKSLEELGAEVVGPVATVKDALSVVTREGERLDGAVLDINLRGERAYPVADALIARHVPFIFATGYTELLPAKPYTSVPRCEKPIDKAQLAKLLTAAAVERH
jgi:CheY-like chemotaxis protein